MSEHSASAPRLGNLCARLGLSLGVAKAEPRSYGVQNFIRFLVLLAVVAGAAACGQRLAPPPPSPGYGPQPEGEIPPRSGDRTRVSPTRDVPQGAEVDTPAPVGDLILGSPWASHDGIEERVDWWMEYWQGRARGGFGRYLTRMGRFEHLVAEEVEAAGVPPSLRYLPVIEAGYLPTAISPVGAAGLWQFMPPTARWLGLEVNSFVDQRLDPYAATPVALEYLQRLYDQFGSWWLTLAAYNVGPGRVERTIKKYASDAPRDDALYWRIRPHLPVETQEFLPKFLAAVRLAKAPSQYGFGDIDRLPSEVFDLVDIIGAASLDVVAETAGVSEGDLRALNPHLVRGMTPSGVTTPVRVPLGYGSGFAERFAAVPESERVTVTEHVIQNGETFGHIAAMYRVSVSEVRAANPAIQPKRLQIGARLMIPQSGVRGRSQAVAGVDARRSQASPSSAPPATSSRSRGTLTAGRVHVVSTGESLWTIGQRYDVHVEQLQGWNGIEGGESIYPGDELRIKEPGSETYTVRGGDTVWDIAKARGLHPDELLRYNGLSSSDVIRPGDEIQIPPQNP